MAHADWLAFSLQMLAAQVLGSQRITKVVNLVSCVRDDVMSSVDFIVQCMLVTTKDILFTIVQYNLKKIYSCYSSYIKNILYNFLPCHVNPILYCKPVVSRSCCL